MRVAFLMLTRAGLLNQLLRIDVEHRQAIGNLLRVELDEHWGARLLGCLSANAMAPPRPPRDDDESHADFDACKSALCRFANTASPENLATMVGALVEVLKGNIDIVRFWTKALKIIMARIKAPALHVIAKEAYVRARERIESDDDDEEYRNLVEHRRTHMTDDEQLVVGYELAYNITSINKATERRGLHDALVLALTPFPEYAVILATYQELVNLTVESQEDLVYAAREPLNVRLHNRFFTIFWLSLRFHRMEFISLLNEICTVVRGLRTSYICFLKFALECLLRVDIPKRPALKETLAMVERVVADARMHLEAFQSYARRAQDNAAQAKAFWAIIQELAPLAGDQGRALLARAEETRAHYDMAGMEASHADALAVFAHMRTRFHEM